MTKRTTPSPAAKTDPFIGRAFHTVTSDRAIGMQGEILAKVAEGFYIVQLFSFIDGCATTQYLVTLEELASAHDDGVKRFQFFDSMEDANWHHMYKQKTLHGANFLGHSV